MSDRDAPLLGGRYRLGECLGGGGMADVYRAVDTRLERVVAVKVFRSGTDEKGRERFEEEARLLGGLSHPGLVPVHDASASGDEPYLVMQLVEGETLAELIRRGPLPTDRVAELGCQLAAVLDYVHGNRIVHRDVKPSNVLLSREGRVFLADFGVSRLSDAVGRMTASGVIMGTATYMAPEQVSGHDVGYPADIYALGLVLLECLTGHVEYEGVGAETAMARLSRPPHVPESLPKPLAAALRVMTADDPLQRPTALRCADLLGGEITETMPVVGRLEPMPVVGRSEPMPVEDEPPTVPGTRMLPAEAQRAVADPPEKRRMPVWPLMIVLAGLAVLAVVLFLLPGESAPTLPPASGPAGAERLPEDLANLERLVRG